ncbi:TetR/AcrR family transcriptional regulator [Mumia flava]|uniref:TetR/AcrR family transcriptional regulator n=1 Tax=Mumia flava TaxID=1348852 RepID=UPI001FE7208A|nr:TetR/AcrR family transcriptional regulator [Mumia flava]
MTDASPAPKRADARKNIAAIIDAAARCLARNPDATIAEIADEAGVGRVTLYGHFDSRAALIEQVVDTVMTRAEDELTAVDLDGDPIDAITRLLSASWRVTHRTGALVQAAEKTLSPDTLRTAHEQPVVRMRALLERGRSAGSFRTDQPVTWQVTMIQSILHGASAAVTRGDHTADDAEPLLVSSILSALEPR